jgi:hypothetical protein
MSVVASLTCTPNRLGIVVATLGALPRTSVGRDDLVELLSPRALQKGDTEGGTTIARGVLDEAQRLGLIVLDEGKYRLADDAPAPGPELLAWLHERLVFPAPAQEVGQENFPRALSWFLMQDPARPIAGSGSDPLERPRARIAQEFGADSGAFELTMDARVQNFAYWARYLGYTWFLELDSKTTFVPDPSAAIDRSITRHLQDGELLTIEQLLAFLAEHLPVLEGGRARFEVEALLPVNRRPRVDQDGLSRSTSLALNGLAESGRLELRNESDSRSVVLNLLGGARPVSHVLIRDTK